MEDEEEYADADESESESDYDEDDEEEPQPKKARVFEIPICSYWTDCWFGEQAKKKPTPAKKATAAKKKPTAKKPAKTRDDWIAQGYDGEAVDTAMEAKPALDTKQEIWDAMLERFKFWMVSLLNLSLNSELQLRCRRRPASLSRHSRSGISVHGYPFRDSARTVLVRIQL